MKICEKELGYLIGFFIGDGYSNYNKNDRHYNVEFYFNSVRDKTIINFVIDLLHRLGLNPFRQKDKRYNSIKIKVSSKEFFIFIREIAGESVYFTRLTNFSKKYKLGIISGFIDADGYVRKGSICLSQKDKENLIMIKNFCRDLDVPIGKFYWRKNWKSKNGIWILRISTRFKYLPNNSYKIKRTYSGVRPITIAS